MKNHNKSKPRKLRQFEKSKIKTRSANSEIELGKPTLGLKNSEITKFLKNFDKIRKTSYLGN